MKSIQSLLFTAVLTVGFSTTQVLSEESQGKKEQTSQSEFQVLDKKIASIQAEIDLLEVKGIENLSDEEFAKLDELQDQLLEAQKEKTAEEKRKQKAYNSVLKKLDTIGKSLSSKETTK